MRLVTFNMRGGGSRAHWETLLSQTKPDIAFVQETRDPRWFPADLLSAHDLSTACWSPASHARWGSALWLRSGTCETVSVSGASWWATGGMVQLSGEPVFAWSVHLAPAATGTYVKSAHALLDYVLPLAGGQPVVIGGDWNLTVGLRQHGEAMQNTKAERELLQRLHDDAGLVSAWSVCHPQLPLPQTLRWSSNPTLPYHCDGVFVPAAWESRLASVEVLSESLWHQLSDHSPVVVDLEPARVNGS